MTLRPSGLKEAARTHFLCLNGGEVGGPVRLFQIRAVLSPQPVMRNRSSGLNSACSIHHSRALDSTAVRSLPEEPSQILAVWSWLAVTTLYERWAKQA